MPIILYGSGEFTDAVNQIDDALISMYRPNLIAILPTAAGMEYDAFKWIEMAEQHYKKFNVKIQPIEIFSSIDANNPDLVNKLSDCDWIFFSGGNPNYLHEVLKDSLLWKKVLEKYRQGSILLGSSAGAMIMGKYLLDKPFKALTNNQTNNWLESFGLIDYTVLPHFNRLSYFKIIIEKMLKTNHKEINHKWLGIDEDTAGIFDNDLIKVLGVGKIEKHQNKKVTIINSQS